MKTVLKIFWQGNGFARVDANNTNTIDYQLYNGKYEAQIDSAPTQVNLVDYLDQQELDYIKLQVPSWNGALGFVTSSTLAKNLSGEDIMQLEIACVPEY